MYARSTAADLGSSQESIFETERDEGLFHNHLDPPNPTTPTLPAYHPLHPNGCPRINWLREGFLNLLDRTEQLRAGNSGYGDGLREFASNLLPSMGFANIRHIFEEDGAYGGWRKKSATFPMTKREARVARIITFT